MYFYFSFELMNQFIFMVGLAVNILVCKKLLENQLSVVFHIRNVGATFILTLDQIIKYGEEFGCRFLEPSFTNRNERGLPWVWARGEGPTETGRSECGNLPSILGHSEWGRLFEGDRLLTFC